MADGQEMRPVSVELARHLGVFSATMIGVGAMGLTFIAFEGNDLIATMNEEIVEPRRNAPRAILLSLGVTLAVYLLVDFVCLAAAPAGGDVPTWRMPGQAGERGIVVAAGAFMPAWGVALIVFGGLFSTMSALNARAIRLLIDRVPGR